MNSLWNLQHKKSCQTNEFMKLKLLWYKMLTFLIYLIVTDYDMKFMHQSALIL